MNKLCIGACAFIALSCASVPRQRAVNLVVATDGIADEFAAVWSAGVYAKIEQCKAKNLPTPEQRRDCLGVFAKSGDEVAALLSALVVAQSAVKAAAECEAKKAVDIPTDCILPQPGDWRVLVEKMINAWDDIRPLLKEIKQ